MHPSTWLHDESTIRRHLLPAFGHLSLRELTVASVTAFRRQLVAMGLSGKSVSNLIGTLHKVMGDAVEEGLIPTNPVLRIRRKKHRRAGTRVRSQSDPLTPFEIATFLGTVPGFYRPLYDVWFRLGWRSSEIVALRFRNLDFTRHIITVDTGRMPRFGGIEAEPKRVRVRWIAPTTRPCSPCSRPCATNAASRRRTTTSSSIPPARRSRRSSCTSASGS